MIEHVPLRVLVGRADPAAASLNHAATFAWDILRRRADYPDHSARSSRLAGRDGHPVELLAQMPTASQWGLLFRRRRGDRRHGGPAILGSAP
jgi:hypothetical protein